METIEFQSIEELKSRIKPALTSKVSELKRNNINYLNEEDIFEYLSITYWKNGNDLNLATIVDDILNTPNDDIVNYFINKRMN